MEIQVTGTPEEVAILSRILAGHMDEVFYRVQVIGPARKRGDRVTEKLSAIMRTEYRPGDVPMSELQSAWDVTHPPLAAVYDAPKDTAGFLAFWTAHEVVDQRQSELLHQAAQHALSGIARQGLLTAAWGKEREAKECRDKVKKLAAALAAEGES